jgi:hypothetical protein
MVLNAKPLKRIMLQDGGCVDIVSRLDSTFRFYHRNPCGDTLASVRFESGSYISAAAAEAAARLKFNI